MPTALALLPSPLLGAVTWTPVAERLRQRGWWVEVGATPAAPRTPADVTGRFLECLPEATDLVFIAHSNAGLFVPALQRRRPSAQIFMDAALPPAEGSTPLAPPELYELLRHLADGRGLLPPWTEWWDSSDVDGLFPDEPTRRHVESRQPRLPLSYFRSSVEAPAGWTAVPSAYIAFGDTYRDERRRAESWNWPVATLDGQHLHMLVEPDTVAATVVRTLAELGVDPGA